MTNLLNCIMLNIVLYVNIYKINDGALIRQQNSSKICGLDFPEFCSKYGYLLIERRITGTKYLI